MDTKLTLIAPEDIPDVIAMLREWRLNRSSPSRSMQSGLVTTPTPIYVRNVSGLVIPPYACMQAIGSEDDSDTGQNYIEVDQPADTDATAGGYLFNGPEEIGVNDDGVAQSSQLVRMLTDGSAITAGDRWQPMVNAWTVEPGGSLFIAAGADDIEDDVMRGFVATGGGATLFLFTLTGTITAGTGAATIRNMEDDAEIETSSVRDPLGHFNGLTSGYRGICAKQGGNYYALGPYVTAVRWDDPDLEFSRDNATTWINVDTAEDCP